MRVVRKSWDGQLLAVTGAHSNDVSVLDATREELPHMYTYVVRFGAGGGTNYKGGGLEMQLLNVGMDVVWWDLGKCGGMGPTLDLRPWKLGAVRCSARPASALMWKGGKCA